MEKIEQTIAYIFITATFAMGWFLFFGGIDMVMEAMGF